MAFEVSGQRRVQLGACAAFPDRKRSCGSDPADSALLLLVFKLAHTHRQSTNSIWFSGLPFAPLAPSVPTRLKNLRRYKATKGRSNGEMMQVSLRNH